MSEGTGQAELSRTLPVTNGNDKQLLKYISSIDTMQSVYHTQISLRNVKSSKEIPNMSVPERF